VASIKIVSLNTVPRSEAPACLATGVEKAEYMVRDRVAEQN